MKIKYIPYRGEIEPITKVHKSDIELNDKFIEVTTYYEFECFDSDTLLKKPDTYKEMAFIIKKDVTGVKIDYYTHKEDPSDESYPRVIVDGICNSIHIWLKDEDVYDIYTKIKNWVLDETSTS